MEPTTQDRDMIIQMLAGTGISRAIYTVAALEIPDLLSAGPMSATDLAAATGTQEGPLYRLLRALGAMGLFEIQPNRTIALTSLGATLRSDLPGSQRGLALMNGELEYPAWGEMNHCLQTGESGFAKAFGMPIFDYLKKHPKQAAMFDSAMTSVHGRETSAVLDVYPFEGDKTIVDVGGGNGSVIIEALKRFPKLQGTLFDLPHVVDRARPAIEAAGLASRCKLVGGSFFESVPEGADFYTLRHIIHDWYDDDSTRILKTIRKGMKEDSRLLIIEAVVPPGNEPGFGKWLDLVMLVMPGGMERSQEEYQALLSKSGLRLTQVIPTSSVVQIVEASPA